MNNLINEYNEMLNRNRIPVFEYELPCGEFLEVWVQVDDEGVKFSADFQDLEMYFDGIINGASEQDYNNHFVINPDDLVDFNLDNVLAFINENIVDGYLSPNGLLV